MSWFAGVSPVKAMIAVWCVLQILGWLSKRFIKQAPPGPPGGRVVAVHTKAEWDAEQLKAKESGALLCVDFSATWCPPCRAIGPKFAALSEKYPGAVFLKVDVDEVCAVSSQCGIKAMPTFQFFLAGAKVDDFAGADERRIEATLVKHGAKVAPPPAASS